MKTIESLKQRRERLDIKRRQLDARIQSAEARQNHKKRKHDTRRKILIGSYFLDMAIKNGTTAELKKTMDAYLTRELDRNLFKIEYLQENLRPQKEDKTESVS
jgi:hypothetical protein